jgi:hypothetical protein
VATIGGVHNLSSTASALLRISVFSAWAELYTSSARSAGLKTVVEPYLPDLSAYWLASLREYAKLRVQDLDTSSTGVGASALEAGLDRDVVLRHYEGCWSNMLRAVSTLLKAQDSRMLKAMKESSTTISAFNPVHLNGTSASASEAATSNGTDPALFFFVVFGLAFEVLSLSSASASERNTVIALQAIEGCLVPSLAGNTLFAQSDNQTPAVFEELISLLARVASSEGIATKLGVLAVVTTVARGWPKELALNHARFTALLGVVMSLIQDQLRALERGTDAPVFEASIAGLLAVAEQCSPTSRRDLTAVALALYGRKLISATTARD